MKGLCPRLISVYLCLLMCIQDIFVDFNLAQETIAKIGGARQVITNELLHDGIRESGGPLFDKLLNIVRGSTLLR